MGDRTFSRNLSVFSFREMEKYAHNLCLNHAVLPMIVLKGGTQQFPFLLKETFSFGTNFMLVCSSVKINLPTLKET